ncbi:carboxylesterase [Cryptosporidium ryanae]|uniref:carboxylesterase n=1 Tax=Cryptosporidium ryanae TaxID=515981 RepID=UPI00351A8933|nr:carboxylesterase [Cryptosporidium ryanae]
MRINPSLLVIELILILYALNSVPSALGSKPRKLTTDSASTASSDVKAKANSKISSIVKEKGADVPKGETISDVTADSNIIKGGNETAFNIPKLEFYPPMLFFDIDTKKLLKNKRILRRLRKINKNLKMRARDQAFKMNDPYLNVERFTKSVIWRFFNFLRLKLRKRKRKRFQAEEINTFSFEKYLILDKNSSLPNASFRLDKSIMEITGLIKKDRSSSVLDNYNDNIDSLRNNMLADVDHPGDYSGIPLLHKPRRPKNLIIAIVGVCSDELYYEAFKYTFYPFLSQIKMYGEEFEKDTGIIFPHPYLRKFKPVGPAFWSYRYSWADFAFGFKARKVNLDQWMYSVESILKLINYLVEHDKYNPKRIFIYGYSQGGAMALSVALRTKYVLGGVVSTAGFLPERSSSKLLKMRPGITEQGLKTPILLSHCNPDLFFPYRTSRKDVKYLKEKIKANVDYSLMLGEGHSCLVKYYMVYVDWIYSILSNYKNSTYKSKKFSYTLLDAENENDTLNDFLANGA